VDGNLWEFSARKRRPDLLPPWERPRDKPVITATLTAAGNRIPKGRDRRFSKAGDVACADSRGRCGSTISNPRPTPLEYGFGEVSVGSKNHDR